jgi:hypothetical protein
MVSVLDDEDIGLSAFEMHLDDHPAQNGIKRLF